MSTIGHIDIQSQYVYPACSCLKHAVRYDEPGDVVAGDPVRSVVFRDRPWFASRKAGPAGAPAAAEARGDERFVADTGLNP